MKPCAFLLADLTGIGSSSVALASYENSCLLEAEVLDITLLSKDRNSDGMTPAKVKMKIISAQKMGRTDTGCTHFTGQTIVREFLVPAGDLPNIAERLRLLDSQGNDRGGATWHDTTIYQLP